MAKGTKHKAHIYGTYRFMDKDPVIDHLRTAVKDADMSYAEISAMSNVSTTTLYNWFNGGTRKPQHATVMAVYRACGLTLVTAPWNGKG